MNEVPEHIFRAYDIRGIAEKDFGNDFAYRLGQAYAALLPTGDKRPVVVSRDVRLSGPWLQGQLILGLTSSGVDVFDIGMGATPQAYFAVHHWQAAGCIMITGSHNPAEYNGFKFMRGLESMHGEDIQSLRHQMMAAAPHACVPAGNRREIDIVPAYRRRLLDDIKLQRPLKVVIDAGNGPTGVIATPLYRDLGCEVIELYCEPDGRFPHHHPDPTIEANMRDLIAAVRRHEADIGIGFDGDGDRIGIVDEQGSMVWGDMLLLLLSRRLLENHPGAVVISEVKCSQRMYDDITAHGGRPIMWRTGHSPIKAKMKETHALLAGEMSGHIFFADRYFGFDDAIYAGARLMEVIAANDAPLSHLFTDLPEAVSTPEIRLTCPDERKFELVEKAKEHFSALGFDIIDVDGMRLKFDDGFALLRASNTQPGLVLRFEAPDESRLAEMRRQVEGWLKEHMYA
ncbi:MAG: phosphomannomutase/phosphoglucomutase [Mariprofundaceae bacterium]